MLSKFIHNSDDNPIIKKKKFVINNSNSPVTKKLNKNIVINLPQHILTNNINSDDIESGSVTTDDKSEEATMTHTSEFLYNKTRESIKKKLNRTIEFDITDTIRWRFIWRKMGDIMEGLSLVTSLVSTVLSFSAGAFDTTNLAFAAGVSGSLSLALMRATSYALKESKEREEQLNILLDKAKIKQVPSLIYDTDNA